MQLMLKTMREMRHMSQGELAAAIGSTLRKVSSWETLEVRIPLMEAAKIADVFDCTLDELAGREFRSEAPYADPRQAELNRCWAEADDANRDTILSVARLSTGRAEEGQPDTGPDEGPVQPGVTEGVA